MKRRLIALTSLVVLLGALSWPFLLYPRSFLYVRYFDANAVFNPRWALQGLIHVWDYSAHLGYSHARELSYVSIQELANVATQGLDENLRVRLGFIFVALSIFVFFYWYARVAFSKVPRPYALLCAFLYASNPFVVAFVHDGYSGLLVDYALLPACLVVVQYAKRFQRPFLLSTIPVVFLAFGMYTLPSAIISMVGVGLIEWPYIWYSLRTSLATRLTVVLSFLLNCYWVLPLAYDLVVHPKPPILAESAGDIAVLTQFGGITNTLLLRSFPSIWTYAYGARECTACVWYQSPVYEIAMLATALAALFGLWRMRRELAIAAICTIILATGYRYQDELIGIPYQLLMALPTFDTFRSSVKFSALTAMLYSVGVLYFGQIVASKRVMLSLGAACLLVGLPYISGSIIERSPSRAFPNFLVTIPPEYGELRAHRDLFESDHATLLLPDMPLAAYYWGAYGNDFLPAFIDRPTISVSYLPQPASHLNDILATLTSNDAPTAVTGPLMRVLGIGRVLIHNDVSGTAPMSAAHYGTTIATFGRVQVVRPLMSPLPMFGSSSATVPVFGASGIALYGGNTNTAAVGFDEKKDVDSVCSHHQRLGLTDFPSAERITTIKVPLHCEISGEMQISISRDSSLSAIKIVDRNGRRFSKRASYLSSLNNRTRILRLRLNDAGPLAIELKFSRKTDSTYFATFVPNNAPPSSTIRPESPSHNHALGYTFSSSTRDRLVVFNENFDPTWQGILMGRNLHFIPNIMVNYFSNGWRVPAGSTLMIINTLAVVTVISLALTIAIFIAFLWFVSLAARGRIS